MSENNSGFGNIKQRKTMKSMRCTWIKERTFDFELLAKYFVTPPQFLPGRGMGAQSVDKVRLGVDLRLVLQVVGDQSRVEWRMTAVPAKYLTL